MNFTVHFGWWLVPLSVTLAALGWAYIVSKPDGSQGYALVGKAAVSALTLGVALIASLIAWLIWALL